MRYNIVIIPILVVFLSCSSSSTEKVQEISEVPEDVNALMGTWKLVSTKSGLDSFFIDVPTMLIYRKHITPTHYSVVSYDSDGDNIYTSIGGTYTLEGDTYTEKIQYFHPQHPGITGTAVQFNSKLENTRWQIDGYIRNVHLDPESQEYIQTDSTRIEEIWEKM